MTVSTFLTSAVKSVSFSRLLIFALVGFALFRWFGQASSGPAVGSTAQAFSLPLVSEKSSQVSLGDYRGRPIVIEVFAEWCSACRHMAPRLAELARAKRESPAAFLGIAVDSSSANLLALRQSWGIPFDVALGDAQFSSNYGITVLPTIIIVDAEGRISRVTTGVTSVSKIDGWLADLGAARL